jgi:hypothetical protein
MKTFSYLLLYEMYERFKEKKYNIIINTYIDNIQSKSIIHNRAASLESRNSVDSSRLG